MKNGSIISYAVIGLIAALLGFGNFLLNNGGAQRILGAVQNNQIQTESTQQENSPIPQVSPSPVGEANPVITEYAFTATTSGQTAFDVLLSTVENVEYTEYDFGTFIESIGGVAGNTEYFWAFYLNDEKAQAGADTTVLEEGDQVKFIYEKIEL